MATNPSAAHAGDPKDVSFALNTAAELWKNGGYSQAVTWVKRAANYAKHEGFVERSEELRREAEALAAETVGLTAIRPSVQREPSLIEVRDSWISPPLVNFESDDMEPTNPRIVVRPPALSLDDEELIPIHEDEDAFSEFEAATVPKKFPKWRAPSTSERDPLASLTESKLMAALGRRESGISELKPKRAAGKRRSSAPPRRSSSPPRRTSSPPIRTGLDLDLAGLSVFEDLPSDIQQQLLDKADIRKINPSDDVTHYQLVLVISGSVRVSSSSAAGVSVPLGPGNVISRESYFKPYGTARISGGKVGTLVAVWDRAAISSATQSCPWFVDALRDEGDRIQTLISLGRKQKRPAWDETLRLMRLTHLTIRVLGPHGILFNVGEPVNHLVIAGIGGLELFDGTRVISRLDTGMVVHGPCLASQAPAPVLVRAPRSGATALIGDRGLVLAATSDLPLLAKSLIQTS